MIIMKFYTSDNVELDYDDEGEKDAQPVMILTGIGGYKEIWTLTVQKLVQNGFRVVNVDARNQGMSERTSKDERMSRHAMDLYEINQALNLKRPILLGNSMGAATMFAYVSLFTDKGIKAIVDVDQSPKMIADQSWPYGFKALDWSNFPEFLKQPFGRSTYNKINDDLYNKIQALKQEYPYDADLNYPLLVDHAFQDWRDVLNDLTVPLMIIAGRKSPFFDYHFAKVAAAMAKNGHYQIVDDAGHIIMAEQPAVFNKILLDFVKKI